MAFNSTRRFRTFSLMMKSTLSTGLPRPAINPASINTASDTEAGYGTSGISLSSYLQVGRNLYLIPALSFAWIGEQRTFSGSSRADRQTVRAASFGIYYLF
jgi:hypothetical protein